MPERAEVIPAQELEGKLAQWIQAEAIDHAAAQRIRDYEGHHVAAHRFGWPVILAVALGATMLAAGILLFVAAHWDSLSPAQRFALVLAMVGVFHVAGASLVSRWPVAATAMHAIGTVACGAGIFLAAQIFNLQEHWPSGVLLWALAAAFGWLVLRDWVQPSLLALLAPAWLAGEWTVATRYANRADHALAQWMLVLSLVYLSAQVRPTTTSLRRSLKWMGGVCLFPLCIWALMSNEAYSWPHQPTVTLPLWIAGWVVGIAGPLALAWFLGGRRHAVYCAVGVAWVVVFGVLPQPWSSDGGGSLAEFAWRALGPFVWEAVGAALLILWGMADERRERINLGVAAFFLALLQFYFSEVMDKLGRSESLIGFGVLFLVSGWLLERTRRRLIARVAERVA